ncbi:MAG TPA: hypothetical protein VMD27_09600 [Candidatus Aquilonibacter sp.]|nr:hypothetical protein [Candidatus Aquilonibacter sp.]
MLPEWTVVGFSGHRQLADPKAVADGISNAFERLAANHGPLAAISSAASGADTLFVEEVARRNLPHLIILPFAQNRFQQDFSPADWHRILPFIEKATHVEEVAGEESKEGAYMETGIVTADRADVMIFVWDGKPAAGFGGTGDVVDYIRDLGKPLVIIDPATGRISEERLDQMPAKSVRTGWNQNPRQSVEEHFRELDEAAQLHAPQSRDLILRIIFLQLLASAIGSVASAFEIQGRWDQLLTLIEFVFLGFAFISSLQHRKKHQKWMKNRIAAEICRSFLATWHMRWRPDHSPKISIQGFDRLCGNLWLMRVLDKSPPLPLETVRDQYLKERVENQISYFSQHSRQSRRIHQKLKAFALFCTATATFLSMLVFAFSVLRDFGVGSHVPNPALTIPQCLSLLLPLASAAIFSLMITQDYSRRSVRYREMVLMLEDTARRLKLVRTWNSLARITTETEEALLQEVVEWHSFRQFAGEAN